MVLGVPCTFAIGVYPRVAGELVGATEALRAARELAGMRLLTGVCPDVSGLVLQTVEGAVTERALVWSREILSHLFGRGTSTLHERGQ